MRSKPPAEVSAAGAVSLRTLIVFLVLFGAGLYEVVGLPHAPVSPIGVPDPSSLEAMLRSSRPPLDGGVYVVGMLGWSVWAWLVLSLLLQVCVGVAEHVAGDAAGVRQARGIADLLTAPLVRKAVQTSLAGGLVARVALAGVPAAAAAPPEPAAFSVNFSPRGDVSTTTAPEFWATSPEPVDEVASDSIAYTVQPGDNLVGIAERFYGDGEKWQLLYQTNQGRHMADGSTFDRAGVILPGWQLIVPEPTTGIETDAVGEHWYTVRKGDSLAAISARLLGSERRWPELYAANRGARLDNRHVLRDPRLIWPGLVLRVPELDLPSPAEQPAPAEADSQPTTEETAATPTPVVSASASSVPTAVSTAVPTAALVASMPSPPATPEVTPVPATVETTDSTPVDIPESSAPQRTVQRVVPPAAGAGAGAAAAIAGITATALVLRRRRPRPGRTQPESDVVVNAGYAEAEPVEEIGSDADDLAAAPLIAARMSQEVAAVLARQSPDGAELPLTGARLAAVRHGRSSTTLLLQDVPMAARQELIEALPEAATRAFGGRSDVDGMVSVDGDVLIRLTGVGSAASIARPDDSPHGSEAWAAPSMLLRMGLLADRQIFAANWDALSHVLVAAPSGHGADAVLEALLASVVARRSPAHLGLIVIGRPHSLPDELFGVSHVLEPPVDPNDEGAALNVIQLVRHELDSRIAGCQADRPDIVLVVPELADLSTEHHAALGAIMLHGPRQRIRVLAASGRRAADLVVDSPLLPEFGTRLVLRAADEEESIALLGSGDATELGIGGHLLVRVEGRVPVQALGYRVAPDRLAALVTLVKERGTNPDWWVSHRAEVIPSEDCCTEVHEVDDPALADELAEEESSDERTSVVVEQPADVAGETVNDVEPDIVDAPPTSAELTLNGAGGSEGTEPSLPLDLPIEPHHLDDIGARTNGVQDEEIHDDRGASSFRVDERSNGSASGTTSSQKLHARFLGARELVYNGDIVWPVAGVPDEVAMELLVFLGVEDPAGVRADLLSDSLWEEDDQDDEDRSYRLRKRRYRLRRALKRLIPGWEGDPIARMDKQTPIYRLDPNVIESDVHCFLRLLDEGRSLPRDEAIKVYERAVALYRGDLLDRPDVPSYRWLDDGPRVLDLRVKYATMHQLARRRLGDLLAAGQSDDELARAEELYVSLVACDAFDHRLWEALARLHGRRNDLLGLEGV